MNREWVLQSFADAVVRVDTAGSDPVVLVLTGIGGIGKSRLLAELKSRIDKTRAAAVLDLQVPAQRQPETALAVLRSQFGACGVRFPRFDIAYTVLWQRLHPHLRVTTDSLALAEHSEILTDILDEAAGIPVFGTAAKLMESGIRRTQRWRWMRADPALRELDLLGLPALTDAVVYLLAEDLKAAKRQYVLFVDAYEALVGGVAREGRVASVDGWLRDIVAQLSDGLVVIASREPLGWHRHDPDWRSRLSAVAIDDLPMAARRELLLDSGVTDEAEITALASASAGVPFYLHLALDARVIDSAGSRGIVAPGTILERFLHHVDPGEIRLLELLSIARTFDYAIFCAIATEFGIVAPDYAWESIGRYSFIRPAGRSGQFQMHQLMVDALRTRVPATVARTLHEVLHAVWWSRSTSTADRAAALREAIYHGVRGTTLDPMGFLDGVDQLVATGGKQAIDGVLADLEKYLDASPVDVERRADLALAAQCLRAEAAVLLGDGVQADELTADVDLAEMGPVADRCAVVSGHASRIRGRTAQALTIYTAVLRRAQDGPARRDAGLWAADLHMAQGRFVDALSIADELLGRGEGGAEYLAELERLRSLACRFALDHRGSAEYLAAAERYSEHAGSVVLAANLAVNRVELLAMTDPAAAIDQASTAIDAQRELGARHEIGKAFTAVGVAYLILGDLPAADQALRGACEVLDQVGYRSGRARAGLFRALVYARRGQRELARDSARSAVHELQDAEVYPVLIVAADVALSLFGWSDASVARAAAAARHAIQLPADGPSLDAGLNTTVARMAGVDPADLYQTAMRRPASAGFYNRNIRLDGPFGPMNVRVPVGGADEMDLRLLPEPTVLRAVGAAGVNAPRLRWHERSPRFQLHDQIDGTLLDDVAPSGTPVPGHVVGDVVGLFGALTGVPRQQLDVPTSWPADGDVAGVARRLSVVTQRVIDRYRDDFGRMWAELGIPADPLAEVHDGWSRMASRPFRLVHADVHRKNMIISEGAVVFLDWELAIWGDPLYDVAAHLHKMTYLPEEHARFTDGWQRVEPAAAATPWRDDLETYLRHERVKSALVDSVRYAKKMRGHVSPAEEEQLIGKLIGKLAASARAWGGSPDLDAARVRAALTRAGL